MRNADSEFGINCADVHPKSLIRNPQSAIRNLFPSTAGQHKLAVVFARREIGYEFITRGFGQVMESAIAAT
jgi:hypothetical protein